MRQPPQVRSFFLNLVVDVFVCSGSQLQHVGSSSLTRDRTWFSHTGSVESWPLDYQGSPSSEIFMCGFCYEEATLKAGRASAGVQEVQVQPPQGPHQSCSQSFPMSLIGLTS